ncbi:MAG: hypothetical protein KY446_10260 [Proteobacteria bacterium]|nr:hypothetical protein [Pseudomonadota bacterium]
MKSFYRAGSAALCLGGAVAAVALSVAPEDASAQGRGRRQAQPAKAAQGAGSLDRARGAKEAPAAVQAAGVRCQITDAAYLGVAGNRNAYEVACGQGLGFVILVAQTPGAAAPTALDCVSAQTTARAEQAAGRPAGALCRLPANAQPVQGLAGVAREAGVTCTVTNGRAVGLLSSSNAIRYEVGCSEGGGFVLDRPQAAGGRPSAQTCFRAEQTSGGQFRCEFTTKAQSLAALNPIVTASRRSCTVSDARIVGRNPTSQNEVLEVGCQGAPGFFLETAANGAFVQAYDCGRFGNTPCQFTAASAAQERNAQDYGRLLRAANFDCAVSNFKRLGAEQGTGREIVEVACSNRPEGAFALLSTGSGPSEVYDCLLAQKRRQNCTLTSEEALYPRIEAAMTAQRRACDITLSRRMGTTPEGEEWYEFACAQGRNRVVDYRGNGRVVKVLDCREGALVLGGCKLPGAGPAAAGSTRR